jgi:hypothetical protein
LDWIVFGDDWGKHTSTVQHLVRHFPAGDRVLWINSIGMRSPKLESADLWRVARKAWTLLRPSPATASAREPMQITPLVLPWHLSPPAVAVNRHALGGQIRRACQAMGMNRANILTMNPMSRPYLPRPFRRLVYLRLDEYSEMPGVDRAPTDSYEPQLMEEADLVYATARNLLPDAPAWRRKSHYLSQGVDHDHFAQVPLDPPHTRTLGFFGLIAEWLDFALIERVARRCPDWTLEFVGPVRHCPDHLRRLPNVRFLPASPYAKLPGVIGHWSAAWIPFQLNRLTASVNPLKLREYLAAGLPTLSTPLPEVASSGLEVAIVTCEREVQGQLREIEQTDCPERRTRRREAVRAESWAARAREVRESVS